MLTGKLCCTRRLGCAVLGRVARGPRQFLPARDPEDLLVRRGQRLNFGRCRGLAGRPNFINLRV
eukprot:9719400-Lingulodinium_polyedra.AAC.1